MQHLLVPLARVERLGSERHALIHL
jgi:hypothetical protein